jgi:hypothetical protein
VVGRSLRAGQVLIFVIPRLLNYAAAYIAVVHIRLVLEATD